MNGLAAATRDSGALAPPRAPLPEVRPAGTLPRIGLAGAGWIGRMRIGALLESGKAEVLALADPWSAALGQAALVAPGARLLTDGFEALLEEELDGIVIATPSALHATQAEAALSRGLAVFCEKPLARTAAEAERVLDAARHAERLLGVDFSYRGTRAMRIVREIVGSGAIGDVFAVDLVFHNAYGPDAEWFYDPRRAGGGCLMDLGIHLVDLALWTLGFPGVEGVSCRLFAAGRPLSPGTGRAEDYAEARLDLAGGAAVRIACSWRLSAGRDAVIEAAFYGPRGGARMRNVGGSFYDFVAERMEGTATLTLVEPPDAWGGRLLVEWAERLARDPAFDPRVEEALVVARAIDRLYGSAS